MSTAVAGPWAKYATAPATPPQQQGPWAKYAQTPAPATDPLDDKAAAARQSAGLPAAPPTEPVKPPAFGAKEKYVEPLADAALSTLPTVGAVAGAAAAAPGAVAAGPLAPAVEAAGGGGGYATGAGIERQLRRIVPTGEMQQTPTLKSEAQQVPQDVASGAEAEMGGRIAGKALGAVAPYFNRARQAAAENVVAPLTHEGAAEAGADARSGTNPNRGIVSEGLTGTKTGLVRKAGERVGDIKETADGILKNHPNAATQINANPHIDAAIDDAIAQAKKVAAPTERLEKLREAMKTEHGATQGTPLEMNNLASKLQRGARELGAYKNTQPVEASMANAMSKAARGIRSEVNSVVPEVEPLNQRMTDLLDAQAGITKHINAERGTSFFSPGMTTRALDRTLGSAPVRTGAARVLTLGQKLDVPEIPAARPMSRPPVAGLLTRGPLVTPPNPDASFVRGVPAEVTPRTTARQLPPPALVTPPNPDGSFVRGVSAQPMKRPIAGLLEAPERPPLITPPPKDASFVRGTPAEPVAGTRESRLGITPKETGPTGPSAPKSAPEAKGTPATEAKEPVVDRGKNTELVPVKQPERAPTYAPQPKEAAPDKPAAKPMSRGESLKTYYSLPQEVRDYVDSHAQEIDKMPQALRTGRMKELAGFGGDRTPLKERIAMEAVKQDPSIKLQEPQGTISDAVKIKELKAREAALTDQSQRARAWPKANELLRRARAVSEQRQALEQQIAKPMDRIDKLTEAMMREGKDPISAEKRANQLIDAAEGKPNYTGAERRGAKILLEKYEGPDRRAAK